MGIRLVSAVDVVVIRRELTDYRTPFFEDIMRIEIFLSFLVVMIMKKLGKFRSLPEPFYQDKRILPS